MAFWGSVNCVLLMLVAMLCLQASVRRGEERFKLDETVLVLKENGQTFGAPVVDLSLSGAAVAVPPGAALVNGESVSVVIRNVGIVRGRVARSARERAGIEFNLPESIERDLLIRKIFTSGLDTAMPEVRASTLSVVLGLLTRIFTLDASLSVRAAAPRPETLREEKLPAASLILAPNHRAFELEQAASGRLGLAA